MGRWDGKHLRVVFPREIFPWMALYNDSTTGQLRVHGSLGSLFGNITQALNMTYELLSPIDKRFGMPQVDSEKLDGQLGMLWRKEVDIALGPWEPHVNIFRHVHLTPIIGDTSIAIWHSMKKTSETRSTPYVSALDGMVWICLWASVVILALLCIIEDRLINRHKLSFDVVSENLIIMVQTLLQESTKNRFKTSTARLVGSVWLIATYVIMNYFSGELKASSVVRLPTLRINNYDDVYRHRHTHKLLYPKGTPTTTVMLNAPGASGDLLRKAMAEGQALPNTQIYGRETLRSLLSGKAVVICERQSILYLTSLMCRSTKQFFHVSSEGIQRVPVSIAIGRHLEPDLVAEIDQRILTIGSMDVPFFTDRERFPGGLDCLAGRREAIEINRLTFTDIKFSFDSHIVAVSLCTLVLVVEILHDARSKRHTRTEAKT